jgi:hypothetical protein
MQDLTIASTDATSVLIDATDVAATGYNNSRDHFFTLVNCQFRNVVGDLMTVRGFDLVDFNNTTFFYIESPNFGCRFEDVSKLEISSCECIIHPQQTQFALNISNTSTTGFGTIAANAFVNVGITTGGILTGSTYNDTSMLKYDVFANQGLADSTGYLYGYQSGTDLQSATTSFAALTIATFNTGIAQRFTSLTNGVQYNGTKPLTVTFNVSLDVSGVGGNNEQFEFQLYKLIGGTSLSPIAGSTRLIELDSGEIGGPALFATTTVNQNDVLTVYYRSPTNDDFTLSNFSIQIKTVDVYPTDGQYTDVVYNVHWIVTGTSDQVDPDGNPYTGRSIGTQILDTSTITDFIPFADLTNEQAVEWTKGAMGAEQVAEIEANVEAQINQEINPTSITMTIGE